MTDNEHKTEAAGGLSGLTELLGRMRLLEEDHEPLGWPAVRMQDISALCAVAETALKLDAAMEPHRFVILLTDLFDIMTKQTIFSPDRIYRYTLWREWIGGDGYAMFVGLNPSTADETQDDPTIRRCIAFAKSWGYAGLCMTNLFAFRATDPKDMLAQGDPVGDENDDWLVRIASDAGVVVAAWGVHGTHLGRDKDVRAMLPNLHCLALTKEGHPGHPLYLRKTLTPVQMVSNVEINGPRPQAEGPR